MHHCKLHYREEVDSELREPRVDPTAFVRPDDRLLDYAATRGGLLIEDGSAVMPKLLVFLFRNQWLVPVFKKPATPAVGAVGYVTRKLRWPLAWPPQLWSDRGLIYPRSDARRIARPAARRFDRLPRPSTISEQVELSPNCTTGAAIIEVVQLFRVATAAFLEAPAAVWLADTNKPSMHHNCLSIVQSAAFHCIALRGFDRIRHKLAISDNRRTRSATHQTGWAGPARAALFGKSTR